MFNLKNLFLAAALLALPATAAMAQTTTYHQRHSIRARQRRSRHASHTASATARLPPAAPPRRSTTRLAFRAKSIVTAQPTAAISPRRIATRSPASRTGPRKGSTIAITTRRPILAWHRAKNRRPQEQQIPRVRREVALRVCFSGDRQDFSNTEDLPGF